jgi:tetratricopeptide (TPR) repeat protein
MTDVRASIAGALGSRYEVQSEVGRGGMATVFRAMDRQLGRPVAVKVLHPELTQVLGAERFHREVRITAALQHANIVPVFESGDAGDLLYYTMPLVEGETLRARLARETQLPLDEALRIVADVGAALDCAHGHGIVHRDIKPENILLAGGRAVVTDFGVARAIAEAGQDRLTTSGLAVGTPAYMSPEQAGGAAHLDARTDIYALGCVLYEMLGGEPPFTGPSAQAVLARQLQEAPRALHVVRGTVSPALERVIGTALAKVPADRYATAGAFVAALEQAKRAPGWGTARRWRGAAGSAAVVLAAAVAWLAWPRAPRLDAMKIVVFPLAETNGQVAAGSGEDLAQVISSAMEQAEPLRVIFGWTWLSPDERRDASLLTAAEARGISRAQGARWFVDGSLVRLGDSARVALRLHDAAGDTLVDQRSAAGLASAGALPRLALTTVARLLGRLLPTERGFDLSVLEHPDPAALSDWLLGERYYRRSQFDSALVFYQRAVALDSGFSYAAFKGAQAANWAHHDSLALVLIGLAQRTDARLPTRYREFSAGFREYLLGAADSAAAHLGRAVAGDTAWAGAWMALGEVYYHLLPADADDGATARDAFERAHRLEPEFSPAMFHLTEILVRAGEVRRADSLVSAFAAVHPGSEWFSMLKVMLACARRGPGAMDWNALAHSEPDAVLEAAKSSAGGLARVECAEPGLRALLALNPDDPSTGADRWGALLVLQGILLAQGRLADARAILNAAYTRGTSAVLRIYIVASSQGAGTDSGAAFAVRAVLGKWPLPSVPTPVLWDVGIWAWHSGNLARLDSIVGILRARLPRGGPLDSVVAAGMAGRVSLLRGDTAAAVRQLEAVRAVGSTSELAWDFCAPAAEERALLARVLLARREYERAAAVAAAFDISTPMAFLAHVSEGLRIRAAAARGMGRGRLAAALEARLSQLARASEADARKE